MLFRISRVSSPPRCSKPEPYLPTQGEDGAKLRKHHPEKWRRLGFETESPAWEFDETGYLGMMDLVEYCRRNEDIYQKTLLEQSVLPREQRCPLARSSLSITLILYEHFVVYVKAKSVTDAEPSSDRGCLIPLIVDTCAMVVYTCLSLDDRRPICCLCLKCQWYSRKSENTRQSTSEELFEFQDHSTQLQPFYLYFTIPFVAKPGVFSKGLSIRVGFS